MFPSVINIYHQINTTAPELGRVVVKIPLTRAGIEAAAILAKEGTRICMTACYTPHQAFTSAALGAEYVAPYLGIAYTVA
jgi:transaldolase